MDNERVNAVEIRRATEADIPAIVGLWLELMEEHVAHDPRLAIKPDAAEIEAAHLPQTIEGPQSVIFIAEKNHVVVGYTVLLILDSPPMFVVQQYGFISEMVVSKEYRGERIGHRLWERAVRWFYRKGVQSVELNVSIYNQMGRDFWIGLGFTEFLEVLHHHLDVPTVNQEQNR